MTVDSYDLSGTVLCVWFKGDELKTKRFDPMTLAECHVSLRAEDAPLLRTA